MMVILGPHALLRAFPMLYKGGNSLDDIKMTESCLHFFKKTRVADTHMRLDRYKSSSDKRNNTGQIIHFDLPTGRQVKANLITYSSKTPYLRKISSFVIVSATPRGFKTVLPQRIRIS